VHGVEQVDRHFSNRFVGHGFGGHGFVSGKRFPDVFGGVRAVSSRRFDRNRRASGDSRRLDASESSDP
jgi:hypothetical protein